MERVVELVIDEENEFSGIDAISLVENPAIEEEFVALKKVPLLLKEIDPEKRILMGAALVPDKKILRKDKDGKYFIYFSKDTVRKASELFLERGHQSKATLEHQEKLSGVTVVESWLVEDKQKDKSYKYGFDVPVGTWMVSMKIHNDEVWEKAKSGELNGFSIEGFFADNATSKPLADLPLSVCDECLEELNAEFELLEILSKLDEKVELESYGGYPKSAVNNAKRGIELNEKIGNRCATQVGKVRARQIAKGSTKFTVSTLKRIYSYLTRSAVHYDPSNTEACGTISYLLWGGKSMLNWTTSKLKGLNEIEAASVIIDGRAAYSTKEEAEKAAKDIGCEGYHTHEYEGDTWYMPCKEHKLNTSLYSEKINDDFAIINDRLGYATKEMAEKISKDIGCQGIHTHDYMGQIWYMPCKQHALSIEQFKKYSCPPGFKKDYKKHKCVRMTEEELAEVGPRGGIRKSPKAPKSGTPNPNPKGKGTAKGTAKGKRGAKVSAKDRATLQKKADDFNKRYKEKIGYGVTVGMLASVFQRGLGAFNTSRSPRVSSPSQWAFARVNAFLYLVRNKRPQNAKYVTDNDLLPSKHPKAT